MAIDPPRSDSERVRDRLSRDVYEKQMQLAAMVVHELRGSAHAIQAYASVLASEAPGPLNTVQRDFLLSMGKAIRRLDRLVNDIQIIVAGSRGFSIDIERVDVLATVEACAAELDSSANAFGVSIRIDGTGPTLIDVDPVRVEQIILNLLENAIKYSAAGTPIRVRVRPSRTRVLLLVENQLERPLEGVPSHWFAPFVRGTGSSEDHPGGFGLGLAVVKMLVSAHGGHVVTRARGTTVAIGMVLPVRGVVVPESDREGDPM
ncbi:MAG: HAMP domain-containing histidine kinase [Chloroflexota bacterium]|nr:HAMP domain-containing histidine kinase [Chloroflexota bacterium]